ncbi:MAG TPA: DUF421 domain-containing protein [Bacilli bacterium]|nr:MAG: hypothetical protein BWX94_00193 [Tenericutes bacterium ADurb.Bin140]HOE78037.1 DUF421 domain-containing protein [Bacilli bacterium]HOR95742.1 DUF421 domain-containing protein [Bacilli bacterium]HPD13108.1 DUF421 domain-containing protein [Bacilli bacterium]HRS31077.1 DUF421 domain-containing protein [Bacilli bacterium]
MEWDLINVLLRTLISYVLLIILMKFMGKREVGQLSLFDVMILLTIVDIMVVGIEKYDSTLWFSFLPMILLALIERFLGFLSIRIPALRRLLDGKEAIIIQNGKLQVKTMLKERYNMDDLLLHLRQKNIRSIEEVEYAILETNGRLSVFTKEENTDDIYPLPIILSGKLVKENLSPVQLGEEWVRKELKNHQIEDIKDVYCALYQQGKLKIIKYDKK